MTSDKQNAVTSGCLLSNGRYSTFLTSAGTGQSRRFDHVVNRWPGDPVEDSYGSFIYLRDLESGATWSVAMQPIPHNPSRYETSRSPGQFHLFNEHEQVEAELHVAVASEEDCEIRRLTLKNLSSRPRRIEVTSYFEAVLNWQAADLGHPAFSKLFLQTEFVPESNMLLVQRRPRGQNETWPILFHFLSGETALEWETDRLQFLGRRRTVASPRAMTSSLSKTVGNVLDPCCSLRTVVELAPQQQRELSFFTGIADTPLLATEVWKKYQNKSSIDTAFISAEMFERQLWSKLGMTSNEAKLFQDIGTSMLLGDRRLVHRSEKNAFDCGAEALFGRLQLSRDRSLIALFTDDQDRELYRQLLTARQYWENKALLTNLIVLTDMPSNFEQRIENRIFVVDRANLSEEELAIISAASSLVLGPENRWPELTLNSAPTSPQGRQVVLTHPLPLSDRPSEPLQFFNSYGGFNEDGSEYVIRLPLEEGERRWPPMPWINVISNEHFGVLLSESGAGCTWARNSQANRMTPWSNDPIIDSHGEAIFLRDEETGQVISPMPGPVKTPCEYEVRHGFGYSRFLSNVQGLKQEATVFVPRHDPHKVVLLRLTNQTASLKNFSITTYQELILGSLAQRPSLIVTKKAEDGSLRASNLLAGPFYGGIAFSSLSIGDSNETSLFTCDRLSFIGRFGTIENPAAMQQKSRFDEASGIGLDPCFALQKAIAIQPGQTIECICLLGEAGSDDNASLLISRYSNLACVHESLAEVRTYWTTLRASTQVETPSTIFNIMVNGWLPYQTISCRLWTRSAFYQSSGAYGFRDQLQDAGNLLPLQTQFAREQIIQHARHQFVEGDVLHWWHPEPLESGLRTRFSDDLLWLPYVTTDYIQATGDFDFLSTPLPLLTASLLKYGEDEAFLQPEVSSESADLYEHCCRAIDRSLAVGSHGLPYMGTGDWNDGMNRVGREGRGESVWLGFFLIRILKAFIPLCEKRGDHGRARRYTEHRAHLLNAVNSTGWDGEWYRRAYYDNGDPLGSSLNEECRIDGLVQAWAVLADAAPSDRAELAIQALIRELISEKEELIRLLTPPFVNTKNDPGYIKGYVAGIRENGGQYTHAACWVVMAIARLGDRERAIRLWEMLTPIGHSRNEDAAQRYKLEPYVMPGDVYGASPHIGRGGWSWYTGSSGWMYRAAIESILGIRFEHGNTLVISPCIPDSWPSCQVRLKSAGMKCICEVTVENPSGSAQGIASASVNNVPVSTAEEEFRFSLPTDPIDLKIRIILK